MSGIPFTKAHLIQLKGFVELCRKNPNLLHNEDLQFFKDYIESLGGKIPEFKPSNDEAPKAEFEPKAEPEPEPVVESEESDIELDNTGVIDADDDEPQPMGEVEKEVSEEDIDKSNDLKREAISSYAEGEYEKAVKIYTDAIILNPGSALLYAKRGQCYLMLGKPNACKRDCTRALEINPDCAPAYKFRGRAHRLLGAWEEAAVDLRNACKIDFDEQADEWLREVTPNARKLEEHRRKYERKRTEKEIKEKLERARKAREEHARASAAQSDAPPSGGGPELFNFLNDESLMELFQDAEVAAALDDISQNPANMTKYRNNPKVAAVLQKLASARMGAGGFPGFPGAAAGGFPGAATGGFPGAAPGDIPPTAGDDVD